MSRQGFRLSASERFWNQGRYVEAVLHGKPTTPIQASESVEPNRKGVILGLLTAGLAAGIALLALFREKYPRLRQGFAAAFQPLLGWLEKNQSGHIGDYVLWQLIGVVILGGALGWAWWSR